MEAASGQIIDRVFTTRNVRPSPRTQKVIHERMNLSHSPSLPPDFALAQPGEDHGRDNQDM